MKTVIFCFLVEAKPGADNPEREECEGAYVNCFVKAETVTSAIQTVQELLTAEGWEQVQIMECYEADRAAYAEDEELLDCYDEAAEYGSSAVFYTWEKDEEE